MSSWGICRFLEERGVDRRWVCGLMVIYKPVITKVVVAGETLKPTWKTRKAQTLRERLRFNIMTRA